MILMVSLMKHRNGMTLILIVNMNQRIKELERQCWSHRVDGVLVDGHLHFDTQKFAELIVRECAEMVRIQNEQFMANESHYGVVSADILKHFGVKE